MWQSLQCVVFSSTLESLQSDCLCEVLEKEVFVKHFQVVVCASLNGRPIEIWTAVRVEGSVIARAGCAVAVKAKVQIVHVVVVAVAAAGCCCVGSALPRTPHPGRDFFVLFWIS